jgi:hypothetical protein
MADVFLSRSFGTDAAAAHMVSRGTIRSNVAAGQKADGRGEKGVLHRARLLTVEKQQRNRMNCINPVTLCDQVDDLNSQGKGAES